MNTKSSLTYLAVTLISIALGYTLGIARARSQFSPALPSKEKLEEARTYGLPLNNPDAVSPAKAFHMRDEDPVYGVVYRGHARAYPRWLMISYHIANDTIDGSPLMLAQCEVCSSVSAFVPETPVLNNIPLVFTACGFHGGTFEMCDDYTHSRWQPFAGKAFRGPLKGVRLLNRIPVVIQTWNVS